MITGDCYATLSRDILQHTPQLLGGRGNMQETWSIYAGQRCSGASRSTAPTTTGFRSVKPRKPISEYDMVGRPYNLLRSDVVSVARTLYSSSAGAVEQWTLPVWDVIPRFSHGTWFLLEIHIAST
jgi:hypothetical protein